MSVSTKKDANANYNYIFRPRVWENIPIVLRGCFLDRIAQHPICFLELSSRETLIIRGRWNSTMPRKHLRKMESEMRGVYDKTRSLRFRSKKVFPLIFSEYKANTENCRIARVKNKNREKIAHVSEFIYFFRIVVIFQKINFFATVKSTYNFTSLRNTSHYKSYFGYARSINWLEKNFFSQINVKTQENISFCVIKW